MARLLVWDLNTRYIVSVCFLLLLMLVVGAGKISGNLQERIEQRQIERSEWSDVAAQMFARMPIEKKTVLNNIARENPQLLLRASTVEYTNVTN